ncbi:MAG TPA: lysophospholipid acyltransferase family protein [Isosphaeraceae bacterium]|nr:lysophospholipid acyltransferase family protein [Isosphaeraceae bacterium]
MNGPDPAVREASGPGAVAGPNRRRAQPAGRDRSVALWVWYRFVRYLTATLAAVTLRWRATGRCNVPASGGVLLVSNHLSYLDVFFLGIPLRRPLNYVARSTLFVPVLAQLMRSVGGFPIDREGIGVSGLKETLRRLRDGGIVTLFPEGTRSRDGQLGPLKPGIAVLVARARVPVVPAGLAGSFEVWPRSRAVPVLHPIRIHYGRPIWPEDLAGLPADAVTDLIQRRLQESRLEAWRGLQCDLTY